MDFIFLIKRLVKLWQFKTYNLLVRLHKPHHENYLECIHKSVIYQWIYKYRNRIRPFWKPDILFKFKRIFSLISSVVYLYLLILYTVRKKRLLTDWHKGWATFRCLTPSILFSNEKAWLTRQTFIRVIFNFYNNIVTITS